MLRSTMIVSASLLALSSLAPAQLKPGDALVSVVQGGNGELWQVNTATRKATQLKLGTAVDVNCVTMFTSAIGWVGSNTAPASVYRINLNGTNVGVTKLNKNR